MSDLYGDDILLWSEQQAELLRQHAAVARENDAIDWPNVIEEIESVGNARALPDWNCKPPWRPATSPPPEGLNRSGFLVYERFRPDGA